MAVFFPVCSISFHEFLHDCLCGVPLTETGLEFAQDIMISQERQELVWNNFF